VEILSLGENPSESMILRAFAAFTLLSDRKMRTIQELFQVFQGGTVEHLERVEHGISPGTATQTPTGSPVDEMPYYFW
jgi:hypothetical protein